MHGIVVSDFAVKSTGEYRHIPAFFRFRPIITLISVMSGAAEPVALAMPVILHQLAGG